MDSVARAPDAVAYLTGLEDGLTDRAIDFAKTHGYAPYTTTIRAAWVGAVRGLTEALGLYLDEVGEGASGPRADVDYRSHRRFARMRALARQHRSLGITLELYIGLLKHFRRAYLDALDAIELPASRRKWLLERTLDFFDESELSVTADWTAAGDNDKLRELQARGLSVALAKDRYVAIFESLRNPAFLLDRARALVHANRAALDILVDEGEFGDGLYGQQRGEMMSRLQQILDDVFARGTDSEQTIWLETRAGQRCCFELRLRQLHDPLENTALGYMLQLYDVTTYRNAMLEAQREEREMSRFLATMSHEIRTPLHSVLGAVELLRMSKGELSRTYLDTIQVAGQSLLQTLNNVLDYSKLKNGPPPVRPVDMEVRPALQAFYRMAAVGPGEALSPLSLECAASVPASLRIDWAMVRQVLTNLLSNALRHDDGSGVSLRVDAQSEGPAGPTLRFEVADHGPGLPDDEAEAFYRPFDETVARHTVKGGAGLGLAISRYLVHAMGGQIGFLNGERGAKLWFTVPFAEASSAAAEPEFQWTIDAASGGSCLLVDDDHIGALVSAHQLESLGLQVDRVATIGEARQALEARDYDVVVVDYLLPDGTGPELLKDLRQAGLGKHARFVALTANVEALNASKSLSEGFHRVLSKPADAATLAAAVASGSSRSGLARDRSHALAGVSPSTIVTMTEAFLVQWSDFRAQLCAVQDGGDVKRLEEVSHRLAGTTAQLGITEVEEPLRELERRCRLGEDIIDLVALLDRPIEEMASWHGLPR